MPSKKNVKLVVAIGLMLLGLIMTVAVSQADTKEVHCYSVLSPIESSTGFSKIIEVVALILSPSRLRLLHLVK